jgi:hypothetical protein
MRPNADDLKPLYCLNEACKYADIAKVPKVLEQQIVDCWMAYNNYLISLSDADVESTAAALAMLDATPTAREIR